MILSRLVSQGWIEIQGRDHNTAVRLTEAGLKAMRSPVYSNRRLVELGLKMKRRTFFRYVGLQQKRPAFLPAQFAGD
jgi:DNA-binding PadR family transcriptional regulator